MPSHELDLLTRTVLRPTTLLAVTLIKIKVIRYVRKYEWFPAVPLLCK